MNTNEMDAFLDKFDAAVKKFQGETQPQTKITPPPQKTWQERLAEEKAQQDELLSKYEQALADRKFASEWREHEPEAFEKVHQLYWSPAQVAARAKARLK